MKVELTSERKNQLFSTNRKVNDDTIYVTDKENYNVEEYWAVAKGKGDCEDYALAKMKMLRGLGWPKESLDIAVCKVQNEGHAVLVAHTSAGDYILDNNMNYPVLWNTISSYHWIEVSTNGCFLPGCWRKIL